MKPVLILFAVLLHLNIQAAHIIGGVAHYEVINIDTIENTTALKVGFTMYRDPFSGGAIFDTDARFGLYRKTGAGPFEWVHTFEQIEHGAIITENVIIGNIEHSVQRTTYNFDLELPQGSDYIIAFQRCCRPANLNNVENPGEKGMALQLEIFASALMQEINSPVINKVPFGILLVNEPFAYRLGFTKPDLTTIEFNFISPKESGGLDDLMTGVDVDCCNCIKPFPAECPPPYDDIVFLEGYSSEKPFGIDNNVILDTETSELKGEIDRLGKFNYGIEIKNSLNGILLSNQILDYSLEIFEATSTTDLKSDPSLGIFPNPTSGSFKFTGTEGINTGHSLVQIFSMNGKLLSEMPLLSSQNEFNLNLKSGIYFVKIMDGQKLIKLDRLIVY